MARNAVLKSFYASQEWQQLRAALIAERGPKCRRCGKDIDDPLDIIGHHKIELNAQNVGDAQISLNPANIELICRDCHDREHHRFGYQNEHSVYLVYGPPLSGKTSFVRQDMRRGDLVADMDMIFEAISMCPAYDKPDNLLSNVYNIHNLLIDNIKTRYGKWHNAYVVGGYADRYRREYIADQLGAEFVFCNADKDECIRRLYEDDARRPVLGEWMKYIDEWFERYTA